MLPRHYAPHTPLELAVDGGRLVEELLQCGQRVGWLAPAEGEPHSGLIRIVMPCDPIPYAAALYAALHLLDEAGLDRIVATLPRETEAWLAVHDRLRRAAHPI
jgi:L-threonylcarbamoyladenylate synthase